MFKKEIMLQIFLLLIPWSLPAAPLQLALNWKPEPQFGGFYAAHFGGEFKKQGLDVQVLEGGSGTPTIQMLAAQKVDFAIVSAEEILISNSRNPKNPIVAVFATYQTNPQIIMTSASGTHKTLKSIFTSEGFLSWQSGLTFAQFLMKKYAPVKVKTVPYQGGIGPYLSESKKGLSFSQQGFLTSEPLLAEKAGLPAKSFLVADEGFNPYTTVMAVHSETLKKNPEMVKKMVLAVRAGWESYLKNPESTNIKMAEMNKAMDLDTFKKSAESQKFLIETAETKKNQLGVMTLQRWEILQNQLMDLKVLSSKTDLKEQFKLF